ncbi:MAG TPA: ABC transporter ATP-binding protein [Longimicrobium sp.]|jgi:ATP-binding cassette subfamily B protein
MSGIVLRGRMWQQPGERPPGLRERVAALRYVPPFLRLVWEAHPAFAATMVALRLVRALVPVTVLWTGKLIVDQVVALTRGAGDVEALWRYVAVEIMVVVAGDLLARGSALVESLLGDLFSNHVSVRMMEHAATLDLEQFEDPSFYDHLERARVYTTDRIGLLAQLLNIGQDLLTLLSLGTALVAYSPWLGLLLVAAVLPSFLGETHYAGLEYSLLYRYTPQRRQLGYLRMVGASTETAKEVQMFGLARWLTDRYRVLAERFYQENRRLSIRKGISASLLGTIGTAGYYAAFVTVLLSAVRGAISLGQLTFLTAAFTRSRDLIARLLLAASEIYEQCLYLRDLFVFFEMRPRIASKPGARAVPTPIREGFEFEDVGFRYPGSDRWAVRHASFRLRPGERIALVGENGAGKTTVTKLLARLYDPTEGRITLDGVDLRDYDVASLRRAISVIFQDYIRYAMRFDENIGVGHIDAILPYLEAVERAPGATAGAEANGSGTATASPNGPRANGNGNGADYVGGVQLPRPLKVAAEQSLASTLLPRLPSGYRQMLGRHFEEGVDLSGGEWQKVALARAYMRDGQLIILDEPTASLDARAEYEVFTRFSALMAGRMAVLISHRFSTVRMADRIVVLSGGTTVEDGTHEELMERGGLYAELFSLQAAGYR